MKFFTVLRVERTAVVSSVLSILAWQAHSADVGITRLDDQRRFAWIGISGDISEADVAKFSQIEKFLRPKVEVLEVELNSRGGDVLAAMKIGELIRDDWVLTTVDDAPSVKCLSACVLIYAAGAARIAGDRSQLGIHRPYFAPSLFAGLDQSHAKLKYDQLAGSVSAYLAKMTLSTELFSKMMKVPSSEIKLLSYDEASAVNLHGQDPGYAEWSRAKSITKFGEDVWRAQERWIAQEQAAIDRCVASAAGKHDESVWLNCALKYSREHPSPLTNR